MGYGPHLSSPISSQVLLYSVVSTAMQDGLASQHLKLWIVNIFEHLPASLFSDAYSTENNQKDYEHEDTSW